MSMTATVRGGGGDVDGITDSDAASGCVPVVVEIDGVMNHDAVDGRGIRALPS